MSRCVIASIITVFYILIIGTILKWPNVQDVHGSLSKRNDKRHVIRGEAEMSSIGSPPKDGILCNWVINKSHEEEEEEKDFLVTIEDYCKFSIPKIGNYIVFSHITFWGRKRPSDYQLMIMENNSSEPLTNCTNNSLEIDPNNPDIRSCSLTTHVKIRNQEKFYFRVPDNNSMVIMSKKQTYFEIRRE